MTEFRPLADNVIVREEEEEKTSVGGIVLPNSATEKQNRGTVAYVGPGKYNSDGSVRPLSVKPGDQIIFGSYAANTVKIDGKKFLIISEKDIYAVIEN